MTSQPFLASSWRPLMDEGSCTGNFWLQGIVAGAVQPVKWLMAAIKEATEYRALGRCRRAVCALTGGCCHHAGCAQGADRCRRAVCAQAAAAIMQAVHRGELANAVVQDVHRRMAAGRSMLQPDYRGRERAGAATVVSVGGTLPWRA